MTIDRRLESLRALKRLLDEQFRLPGTNFRFGWDPIIGLVPWIGDLLTAFLACAIVIQAHTLRVPRIVQLRMLLNIAIDLLVGAIPIVGDAADVFFKSNSMNMALLERHAGKPRRASIGDWLFVAGILSAIAAVAAVPLVMLYWLGTLMIKHR